MMTLSLRSSGRRCVELKSKYLLTFRGKKKSHVVTFVLQLFNCTLDYGKALKRSKQKQKEANGTLSRVERGVPDGLCTGRESIAQLKNTYSDVSQLRITYRSV